MRKNEKIITRCSRFKAGQSQKDVILFGQNTSTCAGSGERGISRWIGGSPLAPQGAALCCDPRDRVKSAAGKTLSAEDEVTLKSLRVPLAALSGTRRLLPHPRSKI